MGSKNFRLEAVLRYRRSLEQKWQTEVADTMRRIVDERDRMDECVQAQALSFDAMNREMIDGIEAARAVSRVEFHTGLEQRIREASDRIDQLQMILQKKREALLTATTNRKVVEKLKEVHMRRLADRERTIERKQQDEFATIRYRLKEAP